jgi:hypothetical protein
MQSQPSADICTEYHQGDESMNSPAKILLSTMAFAILFLVEVDTTASLPVPTIRHAHAVVGAPLTPVSVAGVARRTAVRTTAAASAAAKPPAPPPPSGAQGLPLGTVVSALPAGCASVQLHGTNYFNCQGTYFRPAYKGQDVVYIVEKP